MADSPISHLFYFSPKERRGMLILVIMCILLHLTPHAWMKFFPNATPPIDRAFLAYINQSINTVELDEPRETSLNYFDPNTINEDEWLAMGLKPHQVATIVKFISKGGRFYSAADLDKIFTLTKEDKERLKPYVKVEPRKRDIQNITARVTRSEQRVYIDVNTADSMAWEKLPGIGPVLSGRIIRFREGLGGFVSVDQVSEVYGLKEETWNRIKPHLKLTKQLVRRININTLPMDSLKRHPYIGSKKAQAIVAYREQHGSIDNEEKLREMHIWSENEINRLKPYLEY